MSDKITEKHERMLYPVVRVRTDKAGGSGTVIYCQGSTEDSEYDGWETYILTNCHVVDDNIKVEKKWSTLLKRDAKTDVLSDCTVEFFEFEYGSWESGHSAYKAEIMCYDKDVDLALLRLKSQKKIDYVVKLFPQDVHKQQLKMISEK